MFGWEFPPNNSGGLGVACKGLVQGLAEEGVDVTFVLPQKMDTGDSLRRVRFADPHNMMSADAAALYNPYLSPVRYRLRRLTKGKAFLGSSLIDKVVWYAGRASSIAAQEAHDVIHAHDWLTFPAGMEAKEKTGKPLVVHVHATEFDRTGNGLPNADVYAIEKGGMEAADRVVAVSAFTKKTLVERYGIDERKIEVLHNVLEPPDAPSGEIAFVQDLKAAGKKIILFVGRLTLQKGPDYFLRAAARVVAHEPKAHFVIAGAGDMEGQMRDLAHKLGIAEHVSFAGFLRGGELSSLYSAADIFMMPSVSEPFGLTCLEALSFGLPSIISRQSGVSEVTRHCLKTDFWDVEDMASKILGVLRYPALKQVLATEAPREATRFRWRDAGRRCRHMYEKLLAPRTAP